MSFLTIIFLFSSFIFSNEIISLGDVVNEVREKNPQLAYYKKIYDSSVKEIISSYYPPDPEIEVEKGITIPEETQILIRQGFENPYRYYLKYKLSVKNSEYYKKLYEDNLNSIIFDAKKTYYNYYLFYKYEKVLEEMLVIANKILEITSLHYSTRKQQEDDVLKSYYEIERINIMLEKIKQEKRNYGLYLYFLMNKPFPDSFPPPQEIEKDKISIDFNEIYSKALSSNPQFRLSQIDLDKSNWMLKLARSRNFPDFIIYFKKNIYKTMENNYTIGGGFNLPLFLKRNNSIVEQFEIDRKKAEVWKEYTRTKIENEIRSTINKLKTTVDIIERYEKNILPLLDSQINILLKRYSSGDENILKIFEVFKNLLEAKMEYYSYLVDYNIYKAELEREKGEYYE